MIVKAAGMSGLALALAQAQAQAQPTV